MSFTNTVKSKGVDRATSFEFATALRNCRSAIVGVAVFSALINLLGLTSSIYMLQVYDRVIPSRSLPTLVTLTILMLMLYMGYGVLDLARSRIMSRIGLRFDRAVRDRVFFAVLALPLRAASSGDGMQAVRDLDQIRAFLSSAGPIALLDFPWMPFYIGLVFLLHPWLGYLGIAGAIILVGLTALTEARSQQPARVAAVKGSARSAFSASGRRNAEVIRALGMTDRMAGMWADLSEHYLAGSVRSSDVATTYGTLSRIVRMVLQSAVLGLGAVLVIKGDASGGVMIAASILIARGLAPIEVAIANWKGFVAARQSVKRLSTLLNALPREEQSLVLPAPQNTLQVEGLWTTAPGQQRPIVRDVSFRLEAGDGLGIIGPSASGKSTLVRAMVGAWLPMRGSIRLDGASLDQWNPDDLGAQIGYLPQDIELFDGTVADNISRFQPTASSRMVLAAAREAGIHEMILRLQDGYSTRIGEGGQALSAGQRQRVALARALYGNPFLVVLDEPNSNLDAEGDVALARAVESVRARGGIAVVVAHRPTALTSVDRLLVMNDGQVQAFGSKDEILRRLTPQQPAAPRTVVKPPSA